MLSLHGSAHLRELLGDRCPQRHQTGRPNQDDIKAAVIAFQFKMHRTFSTRPHENMGRISTGPNDAASAGTNLAKFALRLGSGERQ